MALPGKVRSQAITSYCIDLIHLEYSVAHVRIVNLRWLIYSLFLNSDDNAKKNFNQWVAYMKNFISSYDPE